MDGWIDVYDSDGNLIGVTKAADIAPLATGNAVRAPVVKAEEQQFCYGIAYQAGRDPRIAKGQDGGRDFFTEAELEKAAWSFMLKGQQHGLFHLEGTEGAARPVESGIYRNPVPWLVSDDMQIQKALAEIGAEVERLAGPDDIVMRKGDWGLGALLDDSAWQLRKDGKVNGWSPQGIARRRRAA
jgi:hypothetical protein